MKNVITILTIALILPLCGFAQTIDLDAGSRNRPVGGIDRYIDPICIKLISNKQYLHISVCINQTNQNLISVTDTRKNYTSTEVSNSDSKVSRICFDHIDPQTCILVLKEDNYVASEILYFDNMERVSYRFIIKRNFKGRIIGAKFAPF